MLGVRLGPASILATCGVSFQCAPARERLFFLLSGRHRRHPRPFDTMTDRKAVIKNADMSEDMQQDAVDCATQAMEKYNIEKDIAAYIKKVRLRRRARPGLTSLLAAQPSLSSAPWTGGSCGQGDIKSFVLSPAALRSKGEGFAWVFRQKLLVLVKLYERQPFARMF